MLNVPGKRSGKGLEPPKTRENLIKLPYAISHGYSPARGRGSRPCMIRVFGSQVQGGSECLNYLGGRSWWVRDLQWKVNRVIEVQISGLELARYMRSRTVRAGKSAESTFADAGLSDANRKSGHQ